MRRTEISVLEFNYHTEVLRDFCKIIEGADFNVNIFTTEDIWGKVLGEEASLFENVHLFLKNDSLSVAAFIRTNYEKLNNSDVIIFNTIASNFKFFFKLHLKPVVIVRIHNTNTCFNSHNIYTPKFTPFFIWKDFSYFIRKIIGVRERYYRTKFLKKVHYYAFPNHRILDYAISNYNISSEKSIVLPLTAVLDEKNDQRQQLGTVTTIAVIGRIDQRIRDYISLYNAFKIVLKKSIKPIRLILLGSSSSYYKKKVVKLFKSLTSEKFTLISFDNFIEQNTFAHYAHLSNFLVLPIKINTRYAIYNEKFGDTKMSGNISDMIKYKKPALVCAEYPLDENLKLIASSYKNEADLAEKILDWSEHEKYNLVDIEAALKNYKRDNIRRQFEKVVEKIIENNVN